MIFEITAECFREITGVILRSSKEAYQQGQSLGFPHELELAPSNTSLRAKFPCPNSSKIINALFKLCPCESYMHMEEEG